MRRPPHRLNPLDQVAVRMTEHLLESPGTYGIVVVSDGDDDVVRSNVATDDDTANLLARAIVELDIVPQVVRHLRRRYE